MIHNHTSEKADKSAKSASTASKHAEKKLQNEDWEVEVDEYEFDEPKSAHGCGCRSHKDNY